MSQCDAKVKRRSTSSMTWRHAPPKKKEVNGRQTCHGDINIAKAGMVLRDHLVELSYSIPAERNLDVDMRDIQKKETKDTYVGRGHELQKTWTRGTKVRSYPLRNTFLDDTYNVMTAVPMSKLLVIGGTALMIEEKSAILTCTE